MKSFCKLVAIMILFVLMVPIVSETTRAVPNNSTSSSLDSTAVHYEQSTCNAPSQSELMQQMFVSNSTGETNNRVVSFSTQSNGTTSENPFTYALATYVKTKGPVDVPAYSTVGEYADYTAAEKAEIITFTKQFYTEVEILGEPTGTYNCHSYAWYNNTEFNPYWIEDVGLFANDVHTIHIENIDNAMVGDIIVYLDTDNIILHSAIIVEFDESQVICRSKWGPSVLCEHEYRYIPSDYCAYGNTLLYAVLRVTAHTWIYEPSSNNQHTRTCTICNYVQTENCNLSITYNNNGTHTATCATCGNTTTSSCTLNYINVTDTRHRIECTRCDYQVTSQLCTRTFTSNGDQTHTSSCSLCENTYITDCRFSSEYFGSNLHKNTCIDCGASHTASCVSSHSYCGNGTDTHAHKEVCRSCGNNMSSGTESCIFAYKYNGQVDGSNTHIYACTACGYIKTGPSICVYVNNYCKFCNSLKGNITINTLPENLTEE